jgi:hypothetical protein
VGDVLTGCCCRREPAFMTFTVHNRHT